MTYCKDVRLDWLVDVRRETVDPSAIQSDEVFHYSIPVFDETGSGCLEPTDTLGSSKQLLRGGEVLISKLNPRKPRVIRVQPRSETIVASTEFIPLIARSVNDRFLAYWLSSERVIQDLDGAVQSVTRSHQRIRPEQLAKKWLRIPNADAQQRIADFLDAETARIDALIAKKSAVMPRLQERRKAIVEAGASGRLAWSAVRRSTSVPWVRNLPRHWGEAQLKLLAQLGTGHTPSRSNEEYWYNCDIPWVTTGDVSQLRDDKVEYLYGTREMVSKLGLEHSAAVLHAAGTVFLSRTASAGFSGIMGRAMATSQDFVTWTCGPKVSPRYLLLCLRAMRGDLLGRLAQGSTHKTIYMPDIESIRIPLPPAQDQQRIVDEVWGRCHVIDRTMGALRQQIVLLQERRRALITAAVTGEMEVPGVAA